MHIENQDAYERAIRRNIKANAAKTRRRKWFEKHKDAQRLYDWMFNSGEFSDSYITDSGRILTYAELNDSNEEASIKPNPYCAAMFYGKFGEILLNLHNSFQEYGGWTDKQTDVVRNAFLRRCKYVAMNKQRVIEERKRLMFSKFVGKIKERREFDLTIRYVTAFDNQFGVTYINVMEDSDGNVIVGKGTKKYGSKGEKIKVVATIVKHNIREGIEQTIINRPKFVKE